MRSRGSPLREEETESRTKQTAAPNNSNNNNNNIGTILFPNKNNNNNNRLINDNTNNNNNVITFDSINNNNNSNNSSRVRYPSSHLFATNSHFPDKHIYSSYTTTKNYNSNNSNVTNNDYVAMEIANDSTNTNLPPIVDLYPTNNNNTNHNFCVHDKNHDSFMENDDKNTTNNDDDDDDCSVETQDGIHDIPGFWCVCLVILIGDMSRGVFFPSLWPLVECLGNNNGNNNNNNNGKVWLGYAVAAFSLGRILVNPLFGSWSHKYGYSPTLLFSCAILLVGTLMYAQVQTVAGIPLYNSNDQNDNAAATAGTRGLYYLILSQTVMGIGSGTLGVTRAFVADVTARRHRTKYMGWITAVQYGGFTVTPAFGALFNVLLANNREYTTGQNMLTPFVRINMYTAPAYFMASVVLLTIAVLLVIFRDRHRAESVGSSNGKKSQKRQTIDQVANQPVYFLGSLDFCLGSLSGCYLTVYDCCILGCMLLNIATKGSIASFETLGIAIAEEYFAMVASRAGIIIACCGVCGVIALLNLGYLEQSYSDVNIIMGGMFVMMVGIASLTLIEDSNMNNPNWAYTLAMFLIYAIGYPVGHTAVIGLFSKSKLVVIFYASCLWCQVRVNLFFKCLTVSFANTALCTSRFLALQLSDEGRKENCSVGLHRRDRWQESSFPSCPVI